MLHKTFFLIGVHRALENNIDCTEVVVGMTTTLGKDYTALLNPQGFLPRLS